MARTAIDSPGALAVPIPVMFRKLRQIVADPAFIYATKFGAAGILAVFIALVLRLEMPTWALFTVFVLMVAQYVGAIAEKSIFRILGTTVGGILGYILTASLQQQPVFFLLAVGVIIAFCTAMFGQSRYPYAFLLCGMTIVVVTSNGLQNPDNSWMYMCFRVEEVSVGILAAVVVQSVFWPRYARVEFAKNAKAAFADLSACFTNSAPIFFSGGNPIATRHAENFPARISALRGLLDFGARESQYFRNRLSTYFEITTCLSRISSAIITLDKSLSPDAYYSTALRADVEAVHNALRDALDDLANHANSSDTRGCCRKAFNDAFDKLHAHLSAIRQDKKILGLPIEETTTLGLHLLALYEIREQITRAHQLFDSLPALTDFTKREPEPFVSPWPPPFWIKAGIRAGIAVVIGLVIYDWLWPPGGTMFVLGCFVFTALNATSPGGRGDRRAFDYVIYITLAMVFLTIVLIAATPLMSSYAVMNTVIFTWLFVWGYLSYNTHGVTVPMQLAMLCIVGILGFNAQQPVGFQAIANNFFGIVLAAIVAAVIQRVVMPSLPQWEVRNRFLELLRISRKTLVEGPGHIPLWERTRVALIPGETTTRIALLRPPICPAGESEQLLNYLKLLQRVGAHLVVSAGKLKAVLPEAFVAEGGAIIDDFEQELHKQIDAHEEWMRTSGDFHASTSDLAAKIDALRDWTTSLRVWMITHEHAPIDVIRVLGISGRYEETGRDLLRAGEQAVKLRLPLYMGDYVL